MGDELDEQLEVLVEACKDLASLIKDAELPEAMVRRCLSWELAEFVYRGHEFWKR
jgi:hypothetical protein